ncbi:MAG: hypothetical protein J3K34DRAFT_295868 [Monoraphidium minutum]|nr:MAG: hypothetical protein J3K34DRAFT_295868 [Monoraphidium minutum]
MPTAGGCTRARQEASKPRDATHGKKKRCTRARARGPPAGRRRARAEHCAMQSAQTSLLVLLCTARARGAEPAPCAAAFRAAPARCGPRRPCAPRGAAALGASPGGGGVAPARNPARGAPRPAHAAAAASPRRMSAGRHPLLRRLPRRGRPSRLWLRRPKPSFTACPRRARPRKL